MTLLPDLTLSLYHLIVGLHIAVGCIALLLFWVPLCFPRGSQKHRLSGRLYANCMYLVSGTGLVLALMVLVDPMYFKAEYYGPESNADAVTAYIRQFWSFLLFLCVLIFTNVSHAMQVLQVKANVIAMRHPRYLTLPSLLFVSSLGVLVMGVITVQITFLAFTVIGFISAIENIRYCFKNSATRDDWMAAHIGNICGSGVGVYTAFIVFGGRSLFSDLGQWQFIFWLTPTIIGSILISKMLKRHASSNTSKAQTG